MNTKSYGNWLIYVFSVEMSVKRCVNSSKIGYLSMKEIDCDYSLKIIKNCFKIFEIQHYGKEKL